jgi:heat shock protein HslJ
MRRMRLIGSVGARVAVRRRAASAGLALIVTAMSCTGSDGSPGELTGVTWTVASLADATLPLGLSIDATFGNGTIEGSDGCNAFFGEYTSDGGEIDIGGLGGTAIGCEPAIADAGAAFTTALQRAASYEIDDDTLVLSDGDGNELVRMRSNAAPPIVGLTWRAFGFRDGPVDDQQAMVSPREGSVITAEFGADGTMSGSSGCNSYSAGYTVEGNTFRISEIASTKRSCEPASMAQERAYLGALGSVARWKFSGPSFQLLNEAGTVEATYAPV